MRRLLLALVACATWPLRAQMDMQHSMEMNEGPLGIPESRMGSGTSWLPDASPMHAAHMMLGDWTLMLHGEGFAQYDWQGGSRGANQRGIINWVMAAASRSMGGGRLEVRSMLSAEPWTVGSRGYPLLLQSGESYRGAPLHDRQHPHDLFMELAALYERAVARNLGFSLYLAPVGEPAVGPVAFPHRPSAADDPLAPISHHWQDGTHITFGVVTAGVFTYGVKLEGSWFNGREPDERRTGFDYAGRKLDSYSVRLTGNPGPRWSVSAWYAYLKSPEGLRPDESLHRIGVAALTTQALGERGTWSSALIYGELPDWDRPARVERLVGEHGRPGRYERRLRAGRVRREERRGARDSGRVAHHTVRYQRAGPRLHARAGDEGRAGARRGCAWVGQLCPREPGSRIRQPHAGRIRSVCAAAAVGAARDRYDDDGNVAEPLTHQQILI